jgi:hypothetical protein
VAPSAGSAQEASCAELGDVETRLVRVQAVVDGSSTSAAEVADHTAVAFEAHVIPVEGAVSVAFAAAGHVVALVELDDASALVPAYDSAEAPAVVAA